MGATLYTETWHNVVRETPLPLAGEGRVRVEKNGMIKSHPLMPLSKALRRNQTEAEKRLWYALRNRQLNGAKFKRQYTIGNYIIDFVCLEKKLAVELDGGQHMDNQLRDEARRSWLNKQGLHVLRFWNDVVFLNLEGVLEEISRHLEIRIA